MKNKLTKVFITKYALTRGIIEYQGVLSVYDIINEPVVDVTSDDFNYGWQTFRGKEFHLTKEGAIEEAVKIRDRKIASVKKQLSKLEKMNF
ncbi:MAG: hypothetical protein QM504_08100 [Pseudomonadota bacterium]